MHLSDRKKELFWSSEEQVMLERENPGDLFPTGLGLATNERKVGLS